MPEHAPHRLPRLKPLALCLLMALSGPAGALVGEGARKAAGDFYENAIARFGEQDYDGAIIQLKNALQQDAKMLPALVLLGRAQLELGHGEAAETFLKEAQASGADATLTAVPLARAHLLQFKHDKVLSAPVPANLPPTVRAELELLRARAALETNNKKALDAAIQAVEGIDPQADELLTIKTMMAIQDGDFAAAESLIERATTLYPDSAYPWLSRASLLHTQGQLEEALVGYGKVIALDPRNTEARLARIGLLLDLQRDAETEADFDSLDDIRPDDPRVTYLKAVKLSRAGDEEGSRLALARANSILNAMGANVVNRNAQLLLVSGISAFSLGNFEGARGALTQYVLMSPTELGPRKVLASVLLKQRDYRDAIKVLEDTVDNFAEDADTLLMLAEAYEGAGKNQKAEAVLQRATELRQNDAAVATRLALNRVRSGETGRALAELSTIFSRHENTPTAGLPLAVMYLQQQAYDNAAGIARKLLEKQPDNLEFLNVLAIADVGLGRYAAARAGFQQILKQDAENKGALLNIAKLDVREKQYAAARDRLKQMLAKDPNSPQLMLELGRVAAAQGDSSDAQRWGTEANRLAPDSFDVASFLIDTYLRAGKKSEAVDLALEQSTRHRENLYVMNKQVEVLQQTGDPERARLILKQMSALAQADGSWLTRIARHHLRHGSLNDAAYVLDKAIQNDARNFEAQVLLADIELARGELDSVNARAALLLEALPEADVGHRLMGSVSEQRGDFGGAAEHFRRALELNPGAAMNAVALHGALDRAGRKPEALDVLQRYLADHPDNVETGIALAEFHMRAGDFAAARTAFQTPLRVLPDHPQILNNYANVLFMLKDPQAVDIARKAYEQAPANPVVNDTLGWLLVNGGQFEEGLRFLREARTRDSANPEIHYHLAVALKELGRQDEAATELKALLNTTTPFEQRDAAQTLLQQLGS